MSEIKNPSPQRAGAFASLGELRAAHNELLKRSKDDGESDTVLDAAQALIARGVGTGAVIDTEEDRWAAQSLLDYWSTLLFRNKRPAPDATLLDFDAAALVQRAEAAYANLSDSERAVADRWLEMLARPAPANTIALPLLAGNEVHQPTAFAVLGRLVQAGIVQEVVNSGHPGAPQFQLANEALARHWPKLSDSLEDQRAAQRRRRRLTTAAETWAKSGEDATMLWRGTLLAEAEQYADLNKVEKKFVDASRRADEDEQARKLRIATERLILERSARRRTTVLAVLLAIATVTAITAGIIAWRLARESADSALSRQLAAQSTALKKARPQTALLLSLEANRASDTPEAQSNAWELMQANAGAEQLIGFAEPAADSVWDVAYAPDGKAFYTASEDGTVQKWDAATRQRMGKPFSADSESSDGPAGLYSLALSKDGARMAIGDGRGQISVWDITAWPPAHVATVTSSLGEGSRRAVYALAFNPQGDVLASGTSISNSGVIDLWRMADIAAGKPLTSMPAHKNWVWDVAFNADGTRLASAGRDGVVNLWDTSALDATKPITRLAAARVNNATSVTFTPDGNWLISGHVNGAIILRNLAITRSLTIGGAHDATVWGLVVSRDGQRLYSSSRDRSIRVWDIGDPFNTKLLAVLNGHPATLLRIALSKDEKNVLAGDNDGNIAVWNVAALPAQTLPARDIAQLSFSAGDAVLSAESTNGTRFDWNIARGDLSATPISASLPAITLPVVADGQLGATSDCLATNALDASCRSSAITLTQAGAATALTPTINGGVSIITFTPDLKRLVVGTTNGEVLLWDVATKQRAGPPLVKHDTAVRALAFNRAGTLMASGSAGNSIVIWDLLQMDRLGEAFSNPALSANGNQLGTSSLAFSADGKRLASAGADGVVRLWNTDIATWPDRACKLVTRNLNERDEWRRFLPDRPYHATCPNLP
jgi:WD40 repeat protein